MMQGRLGRFLLPFSSMASKPEVRGLAALYAGTFFSGWWAMIIPTIPVLARQFGVSCGGAAQIVTAFALGKIAGTIAELGSGPAPFFAGCLANAFNPGVPFFVYAPVLIVSAALLALAGKETLQTQR